MKLLFPVLLLCALVSPGRAQDPSQLSDKTQSYSLQANSFIDALLKIATDFKLPLAVEWVKSSDTLKPVSLSMSEATASAILDALVSSHGGYSWRLENGIVHVFQRILMTDSRNPLNVRLGEFPKGPVTVARANLYLTYTVKELVWQTRAQGVGASLLGEGVEPQFQIYAHTSLREILNRIIAASKMKVWIATFPSNPSLTLKGFLEETPMYDPKYVHPEDQPFWIFLRWGDIPWKRLDTTEP